MKEQLQEFMKRWQASNLTKEDWVPEYHKDGKRIVIKDYKKIWSYVPESLIIKIEGLKKEKANQKGLDLAVLIGYTKELEIIVL